MPASVVASRTNAAFAEIQDLAAGHNSARAIRRALDRLDRHMGRKAMKPGRIARDQDAFPGNQSGKPGHCGGEYFATENRGVLKPEATALASRRCHVTPATRPRCRSQFFQFRNSGRDSFRKSNFAPKRKARR